MNGRFSHLLFLVTVSLVSARGLCGSELPERFAAAGPRQIGDCDARSLRQVDELADQLESWAAELIWTEQALGAEEILRRIERLVAARRRVDACLGEYLRMRTSWAAEENSPARRAQLQFYLRIVSRTIDVSGRLRYLLQDALDRGTYVLESSPPQFHQLIDMLTRHRVGTGAEVLAYVLFDPLPADAARPFPEETKKRVLHLIRAAHSPASLADLAAYVREPGVSPELLLTAAETMRSIGLPQDPRPGADAADAPPVITAGGLRRAVAARDAEGAGREFAHRRRDLLQWLEQRERQGVLGDTFRLGRLEIRAGDWLLMRNPSPYNRFTDLSPGLFTHVGVVTTEVGPDGRRRFVIVDLPERGDHIPANNVDTYLSRTLHYFFLRHADPAVGRQMGRAARELIGNESQFDLLFRTDRVEALRGKPLKGQPIHTYCAGLLLICAQSSGRPREEFFPVTELPAGGQLEQNLATLGLAIGDNFVSPTGAIFSPRMRIVGACEPMYDPTREVKEAIYDHFADRMTQRRLGTAPDIKQRLVAELARLSQSTPWLARALARAHQVSEHMDLEAAARTAAVVETLDQIANTNVDEFLQARGAVITSDQPAADDAAAAAPADAAGRWRQRHAELVRRWRQQQLSPLELRKALVGFYVEQGRRQLDERFFRAE